MLGTVWLSRLALRLAPECLGPVTRLGLGLCLGVPVLEALLALLFVL